MRLVVEDVSIAFNGFWSEEGHRNTSVLSPAPALSALAGQDGGDVPFTAVLRRRDSPSAKDCLVLHKVQLATGEYRAVRDEKLFGGDGVGHEHEQLVAEP